MKKKILAVFLSLCMAMSLLPVTALAADETGEILPPTASGNNFFANGTPIKITEEKPDSGEEKTFDSFTAEGTDAYISWTEDDETKYVGVDGKKENNGDTSYVSIYGGKDGSSNPVSVASTSITMTGGTVWNVFGGNLGKQSKDAESCSEVTGDVVMKFSGEAKVPNLLHGGGQYNTCVKDTVYMDFNNATALNNKDSGVWPYINGGVHDNGSAGSRDIANGHMDTNAVVNRVEITATNSNLYLVGAGGSGSTKVNSGSVTLNNCTLSSLYLGGINGEVVNSSIVATGCKIENFAATNRGFVGTGSVDLNDCTVTELNTGAAEGCFSSDSGKTDGSGVTGRVTYNIDASSDVGKAVLTPYVTRIDDVYTNTFQNVTVNKAGDLLKLEVASFDAVYDKEGNATKVLKEYLVPEDSNLTLNNVETTIAKDNTLTNAGTINMDDDSSLTVASGATLQQAGTVNGGSVAGNVTEYVARVGNNGYMSLEAALNEVKDSGGTITLLKDAPLDNANYTISEPVTIQGAGTIDATVADGASTIGFSIKKDASLTLNGVTMNVKGTKAESAEAGNDGTAIELKDGGSLTVENGASLNLTDLNRGMVMTGSPVPVQTTVTVEGAKLTAKGIDGNFSNGGQFTFTNATVKIEDCGDHALSANTVEVDNSTLEITGAEKRGISINDSNGALTLKNNASVTVENCGSDYSGDVEKYAVVIGSDTNPGKVSLDATSELSVSGCTNGDVLDLAGQSTLDNKGIVNATVNVPAGSNQYIVTYKNQGQQINVVTVTATSGKATVELPAALSDYGYNHFVGWNDGSKTHDAGAQVTISKNTTFTAVWSYIPPANPNYRIDIPAAEGGTVTADPAAAKAGATVTLTATPDEGYAVGTITVTDRFGDAVKVTENADGTYTFTMPNGQVTVKATFVETQEPAPAEPFPDVDENDWFYDEVVYVYENGLMNGVENNQFAPNTATNRAMLATILYRLAGEPAVSGDLPFTDVESGTWYTDAVLWAAQNGIVNGLGENTFAPMNTLTREQLVTMLYRYAQNKGYDVTASADLSGYPDADKIQSWAQEAMTWAVAEGIVEGMDGNLNPAGSATRAQIATILMRFCEGVAK